jgi:hypothetical protein
MSMSPRLLRPRATGFNPKSISGLVAWFDADDTSTFTLSGTAVSEWRDKSGNGYAVSQPTGNNQPARTGTLRGRATVGFDGTNDVLFADNTGLSAAYSGDKSITAFAVGEMHTSAEYGVNLLGTWFSFGSTSSGVPFWYMRSTPGAGGAQVQLRNDASSATGSITNAQGPAGDGAAAESLRDFFICSATSPSQGTQVWRTHTVMYSEGDGIGNRSSAGGLFGSVTTAAASRPAGNTTVNRFSIGCLGRNTFSDYFPARLSEIIIYGKVLSDAERTAVVRFLAKKYTNEPIPVL